MPRQPVVLEPAVLSRIGRHGRTLLLEYFPSGVLMQSHAAALWPRWRRFCAVAALRTWKPLPKLTFFHVSFPPSSAHHSELRFSGDAARSRARVRPSTVSSGEYLAGIHAGGLVGPLPNRVCERPGMRAAGQDGIKITAKIWFPLICSRHG